MKRRVLSAAVLSIAACGGGTGADGPDATPPDAAWGPVLATIAPDMLLAADPELEGFAAEGWSVRFAVDDGGRPGLSCTIEIDRAGAPIAAPQAMLAGGVCSAVWNGLAADGSFLSPGIVTARVTVLQGQEVVAGTTADLEVVRLGIVEIAMSGPARATLMYGEMDGVAGGFYVVPNDRAPWRIGPDVSEAAGAVRLEMPDGTARPLPGIWTDVKSPPLDDASVDGAEQDTYNLPSAWVAGGQIDFTVRFSSDVAGVPGGGAPQASTIRMVAPDAMLSGGVPFAHDGTGTFTTASSLVPAVGRWDRTLSWKFEAQNGAEWVPIPGAVTTQHRFYGLAGQPVFDYPELPHRAWVEIVDQVAQWVDGATSDPFEVAGRIVEGVYWYMDLVYDNESGASAYTYYPNFGWDEQTFEVVQFQRRNWGDVINCSDAASIVSTYANMVGADIRYHILEKGNGDGFDLNYIQAIGFMTFTETPFTGGRGAFRYHAVTGPPDGTFYDATLALDGDGTPTALPATLLLAKGMLPDDYLFDLSSEWDVVNTYMDEKVRLQ